MKRLLIIAVCVPVGCGGVGTDLFGSSSSSGQGGHGGAPSSASWYFSSSSSAASSGQGGTSASSDASSSATSAASSSSGVGFYWKSGVQQNVPASDLTGWSECYSGLYADTKVPMQQILNGCPGGRLMLACRPKGGVFQVLAMADRADVTFMFPAGDNTSTHVANNVGWYMSDNNWGFVQGNDPLWKGPMDVMGISPASPGPNGDKRVSWTGSAGTLWVGYRCGYDCGDNHPGFDYNYERVVLSSP